MYLVQHERRTFPLGLGAAYHWKKKGEEQNAKHTMHRYEYMLFLPEKDMQRRGVWPAEILK